MTLNYAVHANGEMLADFLNVEDKEWSPKQKRVLEVLTYCGALRDLVLGVRPVQYSQDPKYDGIEFYDLDRHPAARKPKKALLSSLSRYKIAPSLGIPFRYPGKDPHLGVGWGVIRPVPYGKSKRGCVEESYAVEVVLKLANDGVIDRLRQCLCGRWFWAHNGKKISCNPNCRHNKYERTEKFKTGRERCQCSSCRINCSKTSDC